MSEVRWIIIKNVSLAETDLELVLGYLFAAAEAEGGGGALNVKESVEKKRTQNSVKYLCINN